MSSTTAKIIDFQRYRAQRQERTVAESPQSGGPVVLVPVVWVPVWMASPVMFAPTIPPAAQWSPVA